jgi:uncharacterized protein (TIGR01777 family)
METPSQKKSHKILITGGSGFIGSYLTSLLLSEGYIVSHLSRRQNTFGRVRVHRWDPEKKIMADSVLENVDYVIHLAGASIWGKRWSARQKEIINKSRVDSANFLYEKISEKETDLKAFISSSAVGYYGSLTSEKIFIENDLPADDFLGLTCKAWENCADLFSGSGIRTVKIRTSVVLAKEAGALARLLPLAGYGIYSFPGNGCQYMPWIHIKDLCNIYLKALQDTKMTGPYNAVAPQYVNYKEFMQTLARIMGKPFFHPPLPAFILKMAFGKMADMILKGSRISPEKIINTGFRFTYNNMNDAFVEILKQ